jgi:hypothetical protein
MSRTIEKQQAELEDLLEQKTELERKVNEVWQELRPVRLAAIRGGNDPGPLPFFVGLEPAWRQGQARQEQLAHDNRESDDRARAQGLIA